MLDTWTMEDFLAAQEFADIYHCDRCGKSVSVENLIEVEDGQAYCSDYCQAIATAPMVKPQPARILNVNYVDGWDV